MVLTYNYDNSRPGKGKTELWFSPREMYEVDGPESLSNLDL